MNLPKPKIYTVPAGGTSFTTGDILGLPRTAYTAQRHALEFIRTDTIHTTAGKRIKDVVIVKLLHPIDLPAGLVMAIYSEKKPDHGPRKPAAAKEKSKSA